MRRGEASQDGPAIKLITQTHVHTSRPLGTTRGPSHAHLEVSMPPLGIGLPSSRSSGHHPMHNQREWKHCLKIHKASTNRETYSVVS